MDSYIYQDSSALTCRYWEGCEEGMSWGLAEVALVRWHWCEDEKGVLGTCYLLVSWPATMEYEWWERGG
jgi:hypothetical protein